MCFFGHFFIIPKFDFLAYLKINLDFFSLDILFYYKIRISYFTSQVAAFKFSDSFFL